MGMNTDVRSNIEEQFFASITQYRLMRPRDSMFTRRKFVIIRTNTIVHEKREVNEKRPNSRNIPSHNHDSAAPRQHPLICTGAGPIHPDHGQPMSLATKAIPRDEVTFSPFSRAFSLSIAHWGTCLGLAPCLVLDSIQHTLKFYDW